MAALNVFKQVGKIADTDFIAMEVLPIMWAFSLGPLLNLQQVKPPSHILEEDFASTANMRLPLVSEIHGPHPIIVESDRPRADSETTGTFA